MDRDDEIRFDDLTKEMAGRVGSRRTALKLLGGGVLTAAVAGLGLGAAVAKKGRGKGKGNHTCPARRRCGRKCCGTDQICVDGTCFDLTGPPADLPPPPDAPPDQPPAA